MPSANIDFVVKNGLVVNTNLIFAEAGQVGINTLTPDANLTVVGNTSVYGNQVIKQNLEVDGSVNVGSQISVSNSLFITNTAVTVGATTLTGSLLQTPAINATAATLGSAAISGNAVVDGTLSFPSGTSIGETSITLQSPTSVNSSLTVAGPTSLSANLDVGGELLVSNSATVSYDLRVSDNLYVGANLVVNGAIVAATTLSSNGSYIPSGNGIYSLGTSTNYWSNLYSQYVYLSPTAFANSTTITLGANVFTVSSTGDIGIGGVAQSKVDIYNSSGYQGLRVRNVGGSALDIYNDGAGHIETTNTVLFINSDSPASVLIGGGGTLTANVSQLVVGNSAELSVTNDAGPLVGSFYSNVGFNSPNLDTNQLVQFLTTQANTPVSFSPSDLRVLALTVTPNNDIVWRANSVGFAADSRFVLYTNGTGPEVVNVTGNTVTINGDITAAAITVGTVTANTLSGSISSSQVTTALGYTPYNSTNPYSLANSTNGFGISGTAANANTLSGYTVNTISTWITSNTAAAASFASAAAANAYSNAVTYFTTNNSLQYANSTNGFGISGTATNSTNFAGVPSGTWQGWITANAATAYSNAVSYVNTSNPQNFANSTNGKTLSSSQITTSLGYTPADLNGNSGQNFYGNEFYAAQTTGYAFTGSTGYYYMDASNGAVRVPVNGSFFAQDINGNLVTVNAGSVNSSGNISASGSITAGGTITTSGNFNMTGTAAITWPDNVAIYQDGGPNGDIVLRVYNGTLRYNVFDNAGNYYCPSNITAAGNITAFSDSRLKENVLQIRQALPKLLSIQGVEFDWKETGNHSIGVVAQNVNEVFPEVVSITKRKTSEDAAEEVMTVDYGKLIAPVIEAIREIDKRLTLIEEKIG